MHKSVVLIVFTIIIFTLFTIIVSADETVITVVIPNTAEETTTAAPITTEPVKKSSINIYPVNVTENFANGKHKIIKTYELSPNEKPSNIPCDSFERDGYLYELSDITKKDNVKTEQREQVETVKLDSTTKDFDSILKLFPNTKEYNSGGFTGTLMLDVGSITVEQAGTRSVAYTISDTREYPYLSNNDSSYVPKTITDSTGRTLTLSGISWRTQSSTAIDYDAIPDSYTATATYTGTAYKTVITGYEVAAQYCGSVGKTITGKTIYTAVFIGTQIIPPTIEPTTTLGIVTETTEIPTETEITTTAEITEATTVTEIEKTTEILEVPEKQNNIIYWVIIIILLTALIGCYFYYKRKIREGIALK